MVKREERGTCKRFAILELNVEIKNRQFGTNGGVGSTPLGRYHQPALLTSTLLTH
tara:strand:+ start:106 stop:270 length:165 start_codon:yes stop_codon:yes gene_type:complete